MFSRKDRLDMRGSCLDWSLVLSALRMFRWFVHIFVITAVHFSPNYALTISRKFGDVSGTNFTGLLKVRFAVLKRTFNELALSKVDQVWFRKFKTNVPQS